ncbi:hypothetical protein FHR22_002179 [Sphingopyxis panaciterrae]|nr:hypothetical protein [Sphingopyxis panaciterrae]NIJ37495.1 hypothetical protein [Sphingopyxis panaciterrae]
MRARRPDVPRKRHLAGAQPLPHPSWSSPPAERRRVSAQEFWQRLGL